MSAPYADIYCTYCHDGYHEEAGCPQKAEDREKAPYPQFCRHPKLCKYTSSCPRDISCID